MRARLFDFFSGCGGTSEGLRQAGIDPVFALDFDADSINTYRANFPGADAYCSDIRGFPRSVIEEKILERPTPVIFSGCAPCQPFSRQNRYKNDSDPRSLLLFEFLDLIKAFSPDGVFVENVPGMQRFKKSEPFDVFCDELDSLGYFLEFRVLKALNFGVPQTRERLVLVASKLRIPSLVRFDMPVETPATVRDWVFGFPPLVAGEKCASDPDHQAAGMSDINLQRIRYTPEGGGRESWPDHLLLDCHRGFRGHSDVYGRLSWSKPASGLTTKCTSYSNGRFGHPEEDRALSAREAACLQTFPRDYSFSGGLKSKSRQIGNAVPPLMAKGVGEHVFSSFL